MTKYHAQRVQADGHTFDSKAEHRRYTELLLLERAGVIRQLDVHPRFELLPKENGCRAIYYVGDFGYEEDGRLVVEDVKGVRTPVFRIKENLFKRRYPHIELRVVEA